MKINFRFLKQNQRLLLCREVCKSLGLGLLPNHEAGLLAIEKLTPGDFDNVLRQSRLRPIRSTEDLIDRLTDETKLTTLGSSRSIGFMATGT